MFLFVVFGTRFIIWGSEDGGPTLRCVRCGTAGVFRAKKGMLFFTLFFIIPVLPLSRVKQLAECPNCRTRYEASTT